MRVPRDPRETEQGLMACADYRNCTDCPYDCEEEGCMRALNADTLTLIRQLEQQNAELAKTMQEKDAFMLGLSDTHNLDLFCDVCEHYRYGEFGELRGCMAPDCDCDFRWHGAWEEAERGENA